MSLLLPIQRFIGTKQFGVATICAIMFVCLFVCLFVSCLTANRHYLGH